MCECTPRGMKTWERTHLACFFLAAKKAGKMPALPGILEGVTEHESKTQDINRRAEVSDEAFDPSTPTEFLKN